MRPPRARLDAHDGLVAACLFAVSVVFVAPLFHDVRNLGVLDWDGNLFLHEVPRRTVLEYGQVPLWNPFEFGGIPMLAAPWSRWLSPSFLLVLSFGTIVGIKLDVWLHVLLGLAGAYALGRESGLGRPAAVLGASAYLCGGWFPMVVASGMTTFLGVAAFPWALFFLQRARRDPRHGAAVGAVLAAMLFDGAAEALAMLVLALSLRVVVAVARTELTAARAAAVSSFAVATFAGLAAVKLLPVLDHLSTHQRHPREVGGYSVESLALGLVQRGQTLMTEFPAGDGLFRGTSWGIDETGAYVGVGVVALAVLGIVSSGRQRPELLLSLVFFTWAAFGDRARIGPWRLLHAVPPFSFSRVPERFRFVFLLDLSLFAAFGLEALRERFSNRWTWARPAAVVVAAGVVLDLLSANRAVFSDAFRIPPVVAEKSGGFAQILQLPRYDERGFVPEGREPSPLAASSSLYPALEAGWGSLRGFDPLIPRSRLRALHAVGSTGYRGEQWLEDTSGAVRSVRFSPNALAFDVTAEQPGVLVVNQIYDSGWRAAGERAPVPRSSLLAVPVPAGHSRVELVYRPTSFVVGAAISMLSVLAILAWLVRERRRARGGGSSVEGRDVRSLGARAVPG